MPIICYKHNGVRIPPRTMKRWMMLTWGLLVLPLGGLARLGETEPELVARLGEPLTHTDEITPTQGKMIAFGKRYYFKQGDWSIECVIVDGRCAKEVYRKPGEWTEEQFRSILASEAQGARWADRSQESAKKFRREWRRDDGATAVWGFVSGLAVTHPAYVRAKERAEAKAKADASRVPRF